MKFLLLIHGDERERRSLPDSERHAVAGAFAALADRARDEGRLLGAAQLHPTERATTVRVVDGETVVTDGPYAETSEPLAGCALVEAASIDEAVELVEELAPPREPGGVEVRPVHEEDGGEGS
ncbi:MAG: YciI family protein [Thermoleophilia bacterium]|nr:YciI family protein [Thermoleophilia bacterium]